MTDRVQMTAKTTFHNPAITGGTGGTVTDGQTFETDPAHARDLVRLGHAEPTSGSIDDIPDLALQAHHTVSAIALAADQKRRAAVSVPVKPAAAAKTVKADA